MISAAFPYQKQRRRVLGSEMAYVEVGQGDPIVLLHGNPTSSYLWRNVLPHLQPLGRCIALDLIGMGDSDKLPNSGTDSYRFVEHRRYLDALLDALDVRERVTFVIHDWGSALGFDWANRHRGAVKGIAFMEAIVAPQGKDHWDTMGMRSALEGVRSEAGEAMVLQNNYFIEEILPKAIVRKISDEEMAEYRRPFREPGEGRRPTLPIDGEPAAYYSAYGAMSPSELAGLAALKKAIAERKSEGARPRVEILGLAQGCAAEVAVSGAITLGRSGKALAPLGELAALGVTLFTDDGAGGADPALGTGLAGVERRLATFDGILAVNSPPGGPTIVVIEVPCALSSPKTSSC